MNEKNLSFHLHLVYLFSISHYLRAEKSTCDLVDQVSPCHFLSMTLRHQQCLFYCHIYVLFVLWMVYWLTHLLGLYFLVVHHVVMYLRDCFCLFNFLLSIKEKNIRMILMMILYNVKFLLCFCCKYLFYCC